MSKEKKRPWLKYLPLIVQIIFSLIQIYQVNTHHKNQIELENFKVDFENKRKSYARMMYLLDVSFRDCYTAKEGSYDEDLSEIKKLYPSLAIFLNDDDRKIMDNNIKTFDDHCRVVMNWCQKNKKKKERVSESDVPPEYVKKHKIIVETINNTLIRQVFQKTNESNGTKCDSIYPL